MFKLLLPYTAPDTTVHTVVQSQRILAGSEADNTLNDMVTNPIYNEDFFISIL